MNNYPNYVETDGIKFKINTDYRVALKCDEISRSDISDNERALAIIYLLFGNEGLNATKQWNKLIELGLRYLSLDEKVEGQEEEVNMDFEQDWNYISASFMSDYSIDLSKTDMHWWQFCNLLNGLTENSVFSRVRFVRDYDISQIKDQKEKAKWIKQKKQVALRKKPRAKTAEEIKMDKLWEEQTRRK